jgi:hypothetical protein
MITGDGLRSRACGCLDLAGARQSEGELVIVDPQLETIDTLVDA